MAWGIRLRMELVFAAVKVNDAGAVLLLGIEKG